MFQPPLFPRTDVVTRLDRTLKSNVSVDWDEKLEAVTIRGPYNEKLIPIYRTNGATWSPAARAWIISLDRAQVLSDSMKRVASPDAVDVCAGLAKVHSSRLAKSERKAKSDDVIRQLEKTMPDLKTKLEKVILNGYKPYRYQMTGIGFSMVHAGRALICDEMGLGKTIQAIGVIALSPRTVPVIYIVPNAAVRAWRVTLEQWIGAKSFCFREGKDEIPDGAEHVIVPWSLVSRVDGKLMATRPQAIVIDEIHYLKEPESKRTKAVHLISGCPSLRIRLGLSGTPMPNRPRELWPALHAIDPESWGTFDWFTKRYCDARPEFKFGRRIWNRDGASNKEELADRLTGIMIRRLKAEVEEMKELPPKQHIIVPVDMTPTEKYSKEDLDALRQAVKMLARGRARAATAVFRRLCGMSKIDAAVEWLSDALDQDDKRKIVVFAHHRIVQDSIAARLAEYGVARVQGGTTNEQKGAEVERFQTDPNVRLIVCSMTAAREAITLTAASMLVFVERDWVPGVEDQAQDRIHRIGQLAKSVQIYYLMSDHPIDIAISRTLDRKRGITGSILKGAENEVWDEARLDMEIAKLCLEKLDAE